MRHDVVVIMQMGLGLALIFAAFNSQGLIEVTVLRNLAHIAPETGITESTGYYSLSIIYLIFTFCNLLVPAVVKKLGGKWSMVIGGTMYLIFLLAFLHLNAFYLYLSSALVGFGAALLWTGNGCFLIDFSREGKSERNTGIQWAMLQSSFITGGFFLLFIVRNGDIANTYEMLYTAFSIICGIGIFVLALLPGYPPRFDYSDDEEGLIEQEDGEDQQVDRSEEMSVSIAHFYRTFELLISPNMLSLSVAFFYSGLEMTFLFGVYTACLSATTSLKSHSDVLIPYCAWGIGAGQIIGGLITGTFGKRLGFTRDRCIFLAFVANFIGFFLSFLILPFDSPIQHVTDMQTYLAPTLSLAVIIALLLGIADACWQVQIYIIIAQLYRDDSVYAVAIYKFFQSLGSCIAFFYGAYLLLHWQLLILAIFCFGAVVFFLRLSHKIYIAENIESRND